MKNLNKVFAMLLVVAMMMTSVVFADFSDVAADAAYAEAVNVGAALGLFNGYEDGTFKPEGDITRAEFAAIVVRALNQDAQAASAANAASDFADVAEDHWAKGYINIVSKMGIVNGYGDGNFGPEDNVLFEQAVKMLVVALGYEPAIGTAGYPVGYLTKAADIGLTNNVVAANGVAANRGVVAQLILNALDTPLMKQTGYGTWVDYVVYDGYNDTQRETLLSENLGIVKLRATVVESSDTKTSGKHVEDYVKVSILNTYMSKYTNEEFTVYDTTDKVYVYDNNYQILVGDTNINELVGANAIIYMAYDPNSNDDPVALYAAKDTTKTYELTIGADMRESATLASGVITFEYWENESDRKATAITLPDDAATYINGGKIEDVQDSDFDTVVEALNNFYGTVTFQRLNSATAEDYDTIFIDTYKTIVVDDNNTNRYRITSKNNIPAFSYDPEDNAIKAVLYDENGEEMAWEDLVENDVVSIKEYDNGSKVIITGTKVTTTVTGVVTGISDEGTNDVEYTIGDAEYGIDPNGIENDEIVLGDEGTFYLDALGNITCYETIAAANTNYAYVIKVGNNGNSLEERTALKLYTFDGQYGTINTASKVKVDGVSGFESKDIDADMTKAMAQNEYDSLVKKQGDTWYTYANGTLTIDAIEAGQVITYAVNSSGNITAIDRASMEADFGSGVSTKGKFSQKNATACDLEYNSNTEALSGDTGRLNINENTVIMVVAMDALTGTETVEDLEEDDFNLFSTANIMDEQKFEDAIAYNVDDDKNVGFILVQKDVDVTGSGAVLALVSGVGSANNAAGDPIYNIKGVQDGEAKVLATVDDTVSVAQYDTILPKYNAAGEVKDVDVLATLSGSDVTFNTTDSGKTKYYTGAVTEIGKKYITIGGTEVSVDSATYVYIYDAGLKSAKRVAVEDIGYVAYDDDDNTLSVGRDTVTVKALAREYDGDTIEVVLYVFR